MVQSKRIIKDVVSSTGVHVEICHCRKCRQDKKPTDFYTATDTFIDTSGFMSVCKECVNDLYERFFETSGGSIDKTILKLCRLLNVIYDETALQALHSHIQTLSERGKISESIFGIYKNKLISVQKTRISEKGKNILDLTFVEPNKEVLDNMPSDPVDNQEYYEKSWGKSNDLFADDYEFLEQEFAKWKRTTNCDTQGEEVLVREICHKQNEIRRARISGKGVDGLVKSLQEIMKNSALTPALQNAASSGKSADAFGVWIKDIENKNPAEWYEDQQKYKDLDGIEADREDIKRSIGNFITGSRDFNTSDLEEVNEMEDIELGLLDNMDGG